MIEQTIYLAEPFWLWGLTIIPVTTLWLIFTGSILRQGKEKIYADEALIPFLTGISNHHRGIPWRKIILWTFAWSSLLIAMAEPRWDAKEAATYQSNTDLVILLDISRSMDATDVKPSRLRRAKQEIEDLLNANDTYRIGLIAFATAGAVISPITLDKESILKPLPTLSSQLVTLKGSRLAPALKHAQALTQSQPKKNSHHLILISDGDFANPALPDIVKKLALNNIFLHVLAIGNTTGAGIPTTEGQHFLNNQGSILISKLDALGLQALAKAGKGLYLQASYDNDDTQTLLKHIQKKSQQQRQQNSSTLIWKAYYPGFILLSMLILIFLYRFANNR